MVGTKLLMYESTIWISESVEPINARINGMNRGEREATTKGSFLT